LGKHICNPSDDARLATIPEDEQAEPDSENILAKPSELGKTSKPGKLHKALTMYSFFFVRVRTPHPFTAVLPAMLPAGSAAIG
jgi:hypothetical protein